MGPFLARTSDAWRPGGEARPPRELPLRPPAEEEQRSPNPPSKLGPACSGPRSSGGLSPPIPPPKKKASLGILLIKKYGTFFFVGCMQGGREGRPGRPAPPPGGGRGEEPKSALESRSGPLGAPPQAPQSRGSSFTNANKSHKRSKWTSSFDMYVIDTWVYLCPYDKFYSCSPKK